MPTYKNNTSAKQYYNDGLNWVDPGQTITTYKQITGTKLTKTSDEPYYNPLLEVHKPTGSADYEISLNSDTRKVEVYNSSDYDITVYLNTKSNTPGIVCPSSTVRNIEEIKDVVSDMIFDFDGSISANEVIISEYSKK